MNRSQQTFLLFASSLLLAVCAAAQSPTPPTGGEPKVGDRIASFEMRWAPRTEDEVGRRALAVAEVLAGGGKLRSEGVSVEPVKRSRGAASRWAVRVADAPELRIRYLPEYDELRALSTELLYATAPEKDLGRERALEIAKRAFGDLAAAKVVDPRHFNWGKASVATTVVGGGTTASKVISERRVVEYRISLLREINGIEVANAGVRLAVHASGQLSGVRVGGVSIASDVGTAALESPRGRGQWLTRKVETADLLRRFEREAVPAGAKAKLAWSRVLYVMDETQKAAVIEPRYVVSYSLHVPTDDGQVAISRRKVLGYSLTDPAAKPVDLVPPVRPPREGDSDKKLPAGA